MMVFIIQWLRIWWRRRGMAKQEWWRLNHDLCSHCGYGFDPYKIIRERYGDYSVGRVCLNTTDQHLWRKQSGMTVNEAHHYLVNQQEEN